MWCVFIVLFWDRDVGVGWNYINFRRFVYVDRCRNRLYVIYLIYMYIDIRIYDFGRKYFKLLIVVGVG